MNKQDIGEMFDVCVIGGGAAGFFAAIRCAESGQNLKVGIFEAGRPLTKVRISGGGRCNVTHHCFDPKMLVTNYPRGHKELLGPFHRFDPSATIRWFEERGVPLKTEADGRIFPVSNTSQTIIDCLMASCDKAGVPLIKGSMVRLIERSSTDGLFTVHTQAGGKCSCRKLVLATGSAPLGHQLASSMGHTIVEPVPSLFSFVIDDKRIADLAGVSFGKITIELLHKPKNRNFTQQGPCVVTHWGLSGPAALRLSSFAARELAESQYQAEVLINWCPQFTLDEIKQQLENQQKSNPRKILASESFALPKRFWLSLIAHLNISAQLPWAQIKAKQITDIANEIHQGRYAISGKGEFKEEFVTCGGVHRKEINFKTMESKICPGLYFTGEIIDIDAVTGGFNFQNAWTTAWIAGTSIGESSLP